MPIANDSPAPDSVDRLGVTDRVFAVFDRLWPHVAAWGLAALLAFFAVKERLSLMEVNATTMLERVLALEQASKDQDHELRGINTNTTEIRTLLQSLVKEAEDRRGEERRAYRDRLERGQR